MHPSLRDKVRPSVRFRLRQLQEALRHLGRDLWFGLRSGSDLRRATAGKNGLLLNVGCGPLVLPGWINVDAAPTVPGALYHDAMNPLPLADGSVRRIHCEHFLEHLPFLHARKFLEECRRVLEPAGSMRVVVPDAGKYMTAYASQDASFFEKLDDLGGSSVRLETHGQICNQVFYMYGTHLYAWDFETLELVCRNVGFGSVVRSSWNDGSAGYDVDGQDWWRPHESLYAELR